MIARSPAEGTGCAVRNPRRTGRVVPDAPRKLHRSKHASIDAVSWAHLAPRGLFVVGSGPRIPCLPLVTARSSGLEVRDELRSCIAGAVGDDSLAEVCATLKIRRFLERELADYQVVTQL